MTLIVVAAEETRAPVIAHARDTLTHAGARLAGLVMTKRRFHVPHPT